MAAGILKFGRNIDTDSGDDIWDGSAPYPFPAAAATTTIKSGSADDAYGGTGATTVLVEGLDANYLPISQTVRMNGITAVTLDDEYLRVFRAKVVDSGSGDINAGDIQVLHTATVLAQISTGIGQTLMAIYTMPADIYGWLEKWRVTTPGTGTLLFQVKPFGKSWNTKDVLYTPTAIGGVVEHTWEDPTLRNCFDPKTDIRVRAELGANDLGIASSFNLKFSETTSPPK